MFDKLFSPETIEETLRILQTEIPLACWETVYVTVLATAFAVILGLPRCYCHRHRQCKDVLERKVHTRPEKILPRHKRSKTGDSHQRS